ncbi:MAG: metal-dependent transcriptional regulator [Fibrobacteraceae bacterium]
MKLSQSLEDYLEMVHILHLNGGIARVKDISTALGVKMPSVAKAVIELKKLDLVTQKPYGEVELTTKGRRTATEIFGRHLLLKGFLIRLGVSKPTADNDACLMEHILSAESLSRIEAFMKTRRKVKKVQK